MQTKEKLMPRGVRLSNSQWSKLESRAKEENEKDGDANVTPSDVIRYAVDRLFNPDPDPSQSSGSS